MTLFKSHIFVCTNEREGGKECCAQKGAQKLRDDLKTLAKQKFGNLEVRVNNAGCLGFCEKGIAAVIYPQEKWFFKLKDNDAPKLLNELDFCVHKK